MSLLDDSSFIRWIKGEAGSREQLKWEQWEQESAFHVTLKQKAQLLYSIPFELRTGADVEAQLALLEKRIDKYNNVHHLPFQAFHTGRGYRRAIAAAIILFIAMVGVLAFYQQQQQTKQVAISKPLYSTIEVGYGETGMLKISDGSTIRLNSNSTIRYSPEQFNNAKIEVWLQGEAYFSIVRNPGNRKRHFIVHTPDGEISVLGTRFNVNTRFERTGVVLEEGRVEILLNDSLQGVKGRFILKPGQRAQFSSNQANVQIQEVDTLLYTAWLNDKLVFDGTPLKDVIQKIEKTYGVFMKVKDPTLLEENISGSLRNPDFKTLLKGLEKTLDINIKEQAEGIFVITKKPVYKKE